MNQGTNPPWNIQKKTSIHINTFLIGNSLLDRDKGNAIMITVKNRTTRLHNTLRTETQKERKKFISWINALYASRLKPTGHKDTLPAAAADLLLKERQSVYHNGTRHRTHKRIRNIILKVSKILDFLVLYLIIFFFSLSPRKYGNRQI